MFEHPVLAWLTPICQLTLNLGLLCKFDGDKLRFNFYKRINECPLSHFSVMWVARLKKLINRQVKVMVSFKQLTNILHYNFYLIIKWIFWHASHLL